MFQLSVEDHLIGPWQVVGECIDRVVLGGVGWESGAFTSSFQSERTRFVIVIVVTRNITLPIQRVDFEEVLETVLRANIHIVSIWYGEERLK